MKRVRSVLCCILFVCLLNCLSGCGVLTGLPGHGGGKRFAVEQELVASATRGAIKQLNITSLRGKKVNIFVSAIGDTGAGNLVGGRYSIVSQLRGDYIQSPQTVETSVFPRYTSTTSTSTSTNTSGGTTTTTDGISSTDTTSTSPANTTDSTTTASSTSDASTDSKTYSTSESTTDTLLPYPEKKTIKQKGAGAVGQIGVEYKGIGSYHNSEEITSFDLQYLSALLQTYLFLQGVNIVPPSEADVDLYVTVDVFGTVRSRVEWFLANNEILQAKTSLEILAVDHLSGAVVMAPQSTGAEAEYNEQYIFWAGPIFIKETLTKSQPLLSDFTDLSESKGITELAEKSVTVPYPFQYQIKN